MSAVLKEVPGLAPMRERDLAEVHVLDATADRVP